MAHCKPTTIEISVCSTGKIDAGAIIDASPIIKTCNSTVPTCLENAKKCCVCIKITDSHGHLTNFIPLPSNGSFQKHLLEQPLSIVPQSDELEFEKATEKSLINLLVANIPAFGILCAFISVLCFSFNSVIVKLLKFNYGIPGIQVLVTRALFQFTVCGLVVIFKRDSFWGVSNTRWILVCRAFTGTLSMCCVFTAFNMIPIGDATTIYFSSPVLVTVFAYFLLDEPFRFIQFATCVLTVVGVGFISKPEFLFGKQTDIHYPYMLFGQTLAIVAAITSSITLINLRRLKTTPAAVVVFWFAASIVFFGGIALFLLGTYKPFDLTDLLCTGLLCTIGLMSVLEQYFLTLALQHEDATTISVTRSFNIVLAFLWEVVIFDEIVTWTSIVGAVLVSACILLLSFSKTWLKMAKVVAGAFTRKSIDLEKSSSEIVIRKSAPIKSIVHVDMQK